MKSILASILCLACASAWAGDMVVDGGIVRPATAAEQSRLDAVRAWAAAKDAAAADAASKRAVILKAAIARLKVSAATNADIADILTLLKAISAELNPQP